MGEDFNWGSYGNNNYSLGVNNSLSSNYGQGLSNSLASFGLDTAGNGGGSTDTSWLTNLFGGKGADGSTQTGYLTGGLGALQGLGNLYLGFQSYGLAKDQLAAQQQAYQTNLANQVSSYNTNLEDKIRGRTSNYDGKEADVQSYLASHKLST